VARSASFSVRPLDNEYPPVFNEDMSSHNDTTAYIYNAELDTLVEVDLADLPDWAPSLDELRADAAAAGDIEMVRTIDAIVESR